MPKKTDKFNVVKNAKTESKARNQRGVKNASKYHLDDIDRVLLNQLREFPRTGLKELGEMVGFSAAGVKRRLDRPAFSKALERMSEETLSILVRAQRQAVLRMQQLIASKDEKIALEAAKSVLAPMLNKAEISLKQVEEVIHQVQLGEKGEIITNTIEVEATKPKSTMDLLQ